MRKRGKGGIGAGTLEAFTTGVRFRTRYERLLPENSKPRLWASDSERVIQTAQYLGLRWESLRMCVVWRVRLGIYRF